MNDKIILGLEERINELEKENNELIRLAETYSNLKGPSENSPYRK
jgi:hypothetical protein